MIEIRVRVRFGGGWTLQVRGSFRFGVIRGSGPLRFGVIEVRVRVRFGDGFDLQVRRSFRFGVIEVRDPSGSGSFPLSSRFIQAHFIFQMAIDE